MEGDLLKALTAQEIAKNGPYKLGSSFMRQHWEYYRHFAAFMERMPHSGSMKGLKVEARYRAQVLKDAVMAASLELFLDHRILFCCGQFHCDYHLGIPYQLQKNHPELKVAVVVCAESIMDLPMKDCSRIADFIWIAE